MASLPLVSLAAFADPGGGAVHALSRPEPVRSLSWPELEDVLPDGGFPRGVVEISGQLAGGTSFALAAIRAAHHEDARSWCAWIDPEATLHAPGVAYAGVDLDRLLVVRPPRGVQGPGEMGRIAVKVVASRAFDVVVVDMDPVPGAPREVGQVVRRSNAKQVPAEVLVRKLALAAESAGTTVLLLTRTTASRAVPWPVALRLELSRVDGENVCVRVAKDRRGRMGYKRVIALGTRPRAQGGG